MLAQLTISNFAIVRELDIDFPLGMIAITGETGAGKSIAIDALGLCLGSRAEAEMVRSGARRADICARFQLQHSASAHQWLVKNQLDDAYQCILRRVINADGRSKAFINGRAVPLSQLRRLGQLLIQIHGQHAHQLLVKPEHQRQLLDAFIDSPEHLAEMQAAYQHLQTRRQQLATAEQQIQDRESRRALLEYQLKELDLFAPQPAEFQQIEAAYQCHASSNERLTACQSALHILIENEDYSLQSLLNTTRHTLDALLTLDNKLAPVAAMLADASILITEASDELRHYQDEIEHDPNQLQLLEQRLNHYVVLAKKHHVQPGDLYQHHQDLLVQYQQIGIAQAELTQLAEDLNKQHAKALAAAKSLHEMRATHAIELARLITESMHDLAMPDGQFQVMVTFNSERLSQEGADNIEFQVSTNPGQPLSALAKVASGGELSRIALAIQVISAKKVEMPAMIFDEVDVGISGRTAAIVGKMLRKLGESSQVICVTHLPQVAGSGHAHFYINKVTENNMTETRMQSLDKKARLLELARLLGGSKVTRNTLANAKELLAA